MSLDAILFSLSYFILFSWDDQHKRIPAPTAGAYRYYDCACDMEWVLDHSFFPFFLPFAPRLCTTDKYGEMNDDYGEMDVLLFVFPLSDLFLDRDSVVFSWRGLRHC